MRYVAWLIFLVGFFAESSSQNFPNIQFTHLTQKDGLSNNRISCISQDHEGFIWIGTADGLNRYDGYHVRCFYHIPGEKNSLPNNEISGLNFDQNDRLWISTREGFSCYDKRSGVFRNFTHNPSDSNSIVADQDFGIYIDHDNSPWVTSSTTLYHFDSLFNYRKIETGFKQVVVDQKVIRSYSSLVEDRQNQLWSVSVGYLFLIDRKTKSIKKQFGPFRGSIRCIYQDSRLQYWIGSFYGGLLQFDPATGIFEEIPLANGSTVVYSVTEWKDQNGLDWIVAGTDAGMVLVDPVTRKNKAYYYQPGGLQQNFLSGTNNGCVFVDRQNILWISSDGGVSYVQPSKQFFELWNIFSPYIPNFHSIFDYPYACSQNSHGLWVSTWMRSGMFAFDSRGEIQKKIIFNDQKQVLPQEPIDSLKQYDVRCEGSNALWFSTDHMMIHLDLVSGVKKMYRPPDARQDLGLRTIIPYDEHNWWIRTRNNGGNGIYIFDPIARKFTGHYEYNPGCKNCPPRYIMDILITSSKEIYLVSRDEGLFRFDSNAQHFIQLLKFEGDNLPEHTNAFECLAQDRHGLIWIGTFKGLIAYDPVSGKLARDYSNDRLIGGIEISAIRFDEQQNLWMNTQRGIFCVIMSTGEIRNFSHQDGLPNDFADGLLKMGDDHFMYCGMRDYLVRFRPDKLLQKITFVSQARFSEATVMDKSYFFANDHSGEKLISLSPGENRFTLDFSIMNYDVPDRNHYYYRLDGAMKNWQQNENGHLAFYNLAPGKYTLHVRGDDKNGGASDEADIVKIIVNPSWWQTNWFEAAAALFIVLMAVWIFRRRISNIRREANIKQKLSETEMMALRTQMNPHFIFNSLNSIENFIMQNKRREASDYLNKFARLIRMILESSRDDVVTVTKDLESLQLYIDLEQLRFNQKFRYKAAVDKELLDDDYRIPPLLIQPFVENAIVHGLANSDNPDLYLKVEAKLEGDFIKYTIEDNGVGRKQAALYHAQNRPHHKSVGMQITQERISSFSKQQGSDSQVTITDLFDDFGEPRGTRAQIKIKPV